MLLPNNLIAKLRLYFIFRRVVFENRSKCFHTRRKSFDSGFECKYLFCYSGLINREYFHISVYIQLR